MNKYEDIIAAMFNPCFSKFFIFVMCFGLLGVIILFQVILYEFIGGIVNEVFSYGFANMEIFSKGSFCSEKQTRLIVCYSLTIFDSNFFSNEICDSFWYFFSISYYLCNSCSVPKFFYHNVIKGMQAINFIDFRPGFGPDLKFITSISTIIYAYECQAGIFSVISGLSNPTEKKVN